ncbi:DUF1254 domain-containing protein [Saccharopolyspora erythraea]|uniref:DUF1254 domain-containing protein n=1 Tax=Saccharopolyspora erythraea TaxID=1836 RepID=UPI001BAAA87F|nr:DUF1254 domain-containing protein [Saccharopolyspora erythraea]QUH02013.1 DUF1254 domain-containing protein [Saccharopolyspora erythraea]
MIEQVSMDSHGYDTSDVEQLGRAEHPDIVPAEAAWRRRWTESLSLQAVVYGLPAALQYARMCADALVPGATPGMGKFRHERAPVGPDFTAFRAPNVDTLYSTAWLDLRGQAVELRTPEFGDRYFTVQLVDAYSNALNISNRTVGSAAARYWLVSAQWTGAAPEGVTVVRVPTTVMWLLMRIQVVGGEVAVVHELQNAVTIAPTPGADTAYGPLVDPQSVEKDWQEYFRALDAAIRLNMYPREEHACVHQFRTLGLLGHEPWDPAVLDPETADGMAAGFDAAMAMLRSARRQLGVETGTGWTRVLDKGAHGHNFLARAVMNHVGLGANVAEENTSFNTHVDAEGNQLAGRQGDYTLTFDVPPPHGAFWSVTLYHVETGRVFDNPLGRYCVGSAKLEASGPAGAVRIVIARNDPKVPNWLPCPDGDFYLILRIYSPGDAVTRGDWLPAPVLRAYGTASSGTLQNPNRG